MTKWPTYFTYLFNELDLMGYLGMQARGLDQVSVIQRDEALGSELYQLCFQVQIGRPKAPFQFLTEDDLVLLSGEQNGLPTQSNQDHPSLMTKTTKQSKSRTISIIKRYKGYYNVN